MKRYQTTASIFAVLGAPCVPMADVITIAVQLLMIVVNVKLRRYSFMNKIITHKDLKYLIGGSSAMILALVGVMFLPKLKPSELW